MEGEPVSKPTMPESYRYWTVAIRISATITILLFAYAVTAEALFPTGNRLLVVSALFGVAIAAFATYIATRSKNEVKEQFFRDVTRWGTNMVPTIVVPFGDIIDSIWKHITEDRGLTPTDFQYIDRTLRTIQTRLIEMKMAEVSRLNVLITQAIPSPSETAVSLVPFLMQLMAHYTLVSNLAYGETLAALDILENY